MYEDYTMGQMFRLHLAFFYVYEYRFFFSFLTSNSDVTLGAFSKWFKYFRPVLAVDGILNQPRPEMMAKGWSESEDEKKKKKCTQTISTGTWKPRFIIFINCKWVNIGHKNRAEVIQASHNRDN